MAKCLESAFSNRVKLVLRHAKYTYISCTYFNVAGTDDQAIFL